MITLAIRTGSDHLSRIELDLDAAYLAGQEPGSPLHLRLDSQVLSAPHHSPLVADGRGLLTTTLCLPYTLTAQLPTGRHQAQLWLMVGDPQSPLSQHLIPEPCGLLVSVGDNAHA
jgi:hypothetical protein